MPRTAAQYLRTTASADGSPPHPLAPGPPAVAAVDPGAVTGTGPSATPRWCSSTVFSIARKPRAFFRIRTLAWLSASRTGLARSRRKWLPQWRWGASGNSAAIPLTNASCLSETQSFTALPNDWTHSLAVAINRQHFVVRRGDQGLREPDALPGQFPHDIQGLVALLGLQTVDREDDLIGVLVELPQVLGVLLTSGDHGLVAMRESGDGGVGEPDLIGVDQLGLDLGDGPVA